VQENRTVGNSTFHVLLRGLWLNGNFCFLFQYLEMWTDGDEDKLHISRFVPKRIDRRIKNLFLERSTIYLILDTPHTAHCTLLDVTGGKPIGVLLQSILSVSAINPLVAFYEIHGGKREVLLYHNYNMCTS
jgi:hypothetical protein